VKSKPKFARMPWYPADFASSTRTWPLVARGAYRELLDAQWEVGAGLEPGVLPADPRQLRALVRATAAEWRVAWQWVEPKFPLISNGGRQNRRLEEHRQEALELYLAKKRSAEGTNRKLGRGNGARSGATRR
jgi:uncharacterized protein YdaU (DUF1376 family)